MRVVKKEEIEARVEEGSMAFIEALVNFRRGFVSMEVVNFEDSREDLRECRSQLTEAIETYRTLITIGEPGVKDRIVPTGEDDETSHYDRGEQLLQDFHEEGRLEKLFLHDPELWNLLQSKYLLNEPMAVYRRFTWMLRETRNYVDGLLTLVEEDAGDEILKDGAWKTSTQFMRTLNFGQMIAYLNREIGRM